MLSRDKPIWYGPFAQLADGFYGWRDGRAGLPRRPTLHERHEGVVITTGYRESLIRRAQDAMERERQELETGRVATAERKARAGARVQAEQAVLEQAEQDLSAISGPLSEVDLDLRRHGEGRLDILVVRRRRANERLGRVEQAKEVVEKARRAKGAADGELNAASDALDRWHRVVFSRAVRLHEHAHRRMARYRSWLIRFHPQKEWVNRVMGMDRLEMPGWARLLVLQPPQPRPVEPDPLDESGLLDDRPPGRLIPLGQVNHFGSGDDVVRVDGYGIAPRHFSLVRENDGYRLHGYGHDRGPYQHGHPVTTAHLSPGAEFDVGDFRYLVLDENWLEENQLGSCHVIVAGVTAGPPGQERLEGMSFVQRAGTVLAVLGPSGAGKTSLFHALLRELEPREGELFFRGMNVRTHLEQIKPMLGFVPQHEDLHRTLTVRALLTYTDRLRWPSGGAGRARRVVEVCKKLSIEPQLDQVAGSLSGGQLKRVSIAMELLAAPKLLMLDEPTSGLDPGMDREVMRILKAYAEEGNTVIVITHTTNHLSYAQQILVVGDAGRPVYSGPLPRMWRQLGIKRTADSYADLMDLLKTDPGPLVQAYQIGPAAQEALREAARAGQHQEPEDLQEIRGATGMWMRQLPVLVRRQLSLVLARGRTRPANGWSPVLSALAAAAPLLMAAVGALLAVMVGGDGGLGPGPGGSGPISLSLLSTIAVLMGQSLTYSDVVHEFAVIRREHRTGMLVSAVMTSKFLVFAAVAVIQAASLSFIFVSLSTAPAYGLAWDARLELFVALAGTTIAAMALGLLISALSKTLPQAVLWNTLTVIAQIAFNGVTTDLSDQPVLGGLAALMPARWGLAAAASSSDLRKIAPAAPSDALWRHTGSQWTTNLIWIAGLTALFFVLATWALRRRLSKP